MKSKYSLGTGETKFQLGRGKIIQWVGFHLVCYGEVFVLVCKTTNKTLYFSYCKFCFTDLDPCINISCNYFAVCKAFGPRDARCICVDNCPSYDEPVCSSNGTTYDNECVFQREMCYLKANFTLYHPGDCTGNETNLITYT